MRDAIDWDEPDFADLIAVVTKGKGRNGFVKRLRDEHPPSRPHDSQHDDRVLDAFTEGAAFAWAYAVARLGTPRFVVIPGSPDLIAGDAWIEAKTAWESQEEKKFKDTVLLEQTGIIRGAVELVPPSEGFGAKLNSHLDNSLAKWERQQRTGTLTTFVRFNDFDFGVSRRAARQDAIEWASMAERRTSTRIVLREGFEWRAPLYG